MPSIFKTRTQEWDYENPFRFHSETKDLRTKPFQSLKIKGWNTEETLKYLAFIELHCNSSERGLTWKDYKQISVSVQSRNPNQCRILHSKMNKKYLSYPEIMKTHFKLIEQNESDYIHIKNTVEQLINCSSKLLIEGQITHQCLSQNSASENSINQYSHFSLNKTLLDDSENDSNRANQFQETDKLSKNAQSTAEDYEALNINIDNKPKRPAFNMNF